VNYQYSYDLFTETDTLYFGQTWGLPGNILKATERYLLLTDCSYMNGWTNVGSIVWVRPEVVLTQPELAEIKQVYKKKLNWDFPE